MERCTGQLHDIQHIINIYNIHCARHMCVLIRWPVNNFPSFIVIITQNFQGFSCPAMRHTRLDSKHKDIILLILNNCVFSRITERQAHRFVGKFSLHIGWTDSHSPTNLTWAHFIEHTASTEPHINKTVEQQKTVEVICRFPSHQFIPCAHIAPKMN